MRCLILTVIATGVATGAIGQQPPEDALTDLIAAPGLEVTLYAGDDLLRNPTSMDIDAQGRIWIAEAANYRLFNQPMVDERGDRIRVLEDTDGDGAADSAHTFYQDPSLQAPMGIAVLGERVYVCQSPDLFYLEDTDGDGTADKRTVVLTGFGGVDHDHAIHGVLFGPDGHLYMTNGDRGLDVADKSGNRVHAGQGAPLKAATVLRTDLEGRRLEWLAEGMRNPYEPAVDSFGNVFASDNDDDGNEQTRINFVLEGGNYGYWPRRKGDRRLDAVHWNEDRPGVVPKILRTGFGSPTGLTVYEGELMPELRGALIHADAGPGEIRAYHLTPEGAGWAVEPQVLLRKDKDDWFRPSDVCVAPDGSIFVADWYDPGVGGHRMGDVERGRVYRVAPAGSKYSVPPLDLESNDGLTAALASPNQARRYLAYAAVKELARQGHTLILEELFAGDDPVMRARAVWMLTSVPVEHDWAANAARDADPKLRTQGVRILSRQNRLQAVPELREDVDPHVRRQVLIELAEKMDEAWARDWAIELAAQYDGEDRFYREAVGIALRGHEAWAFDELLKRFGDKWNASLAGLAIQLHPEVALGPAARAAANKTLPVDLRLTAVRALDAIGSKEAGASLVALLAPDADAKVVGEALYQLGRDGGAAWRGQVDPNALETRLATLLTEDEHAASAWGYVVDAGRTEFFPQVLARAADDALPLRARVDAIQTAIHLTNRGRDELPQIPDALVENLLRSEYGKLRVETLNLIALGPKHIAHAKLLNVAMDESYDRAVRERAVRLLGTDRTGALQLIRAAEDNALGRDLDLAMAEVFVGHPDAEVRMLGTQLFPPEATRNGSPLPPLEALLSMEGDAARGRDIFFSEGHSQCTQCHAVKGEGRDVGPDLSAIGAKYGKLGLLESILNPSAAIGHEYKVWLIETRDGEWLNGYVHAENDETLEIVDATGQILTLKKEAITSREESDLSLMPTGLAAGLTAQELADLVAWLGALEGD